MTSFAFPRFILRFGVSSKPSSTNARNHGFFIFSTNKRRYSTSKPLLSQQSSEAELLVVVGGGAAGIYGAIRAKTIAPNLNVVVIEKGKPLSKVKISGGGRCNVTNGHCSDNLILAEHYPRGNKELGSFFSMHGPKDTLSWFSDLGVKLKTQDDGRVFPVSNNSSSVVDCLLSEAKQRGDTGMNTATRITGGEVIAEAGIDMIVTGTEEGKEIIVIEAGAAVEVVIMTIAVGEADMIMRGVVEAVHMKVSLLLIVAPVLRGAPLLTRHLHLRVGVLMDATLTYSKKCFSVW